VRDELVITDPAAIPVLFDPLRHRVFRMLRRPKSIREIGAELGVRSDRLYYHVNQLAQHGLIRQVGIQKAGRHSERVFARTSAQVAFQGDVNLGGLNPLTAIASELGESLTEARPDDVASVSYHHAKITQEQASELSERLRQLIGEYVQSEAPPGAQTFAVLGALAPLPELDAPKIRDLRPDEIGFLREMLYTALAWRPDAVLPAIEWVLAHPQVSVFHEGWGRPGDTALVAEEDGRRIGLVWYRLFTAESHGEGFVDEWTPELAIAVVEGHRGKGIGRRLMEAAHDRARADRIARLSLSVDEGNPARRLYESLGYVDYKSEDGRGRMVVDLERHPRGGRRRGEPPGPVGGA